MATIKIKVTKGVDSSLSKEELDTAGNEILQVFQRLVYPTDIIKDYEVSISCDVVDKPTGKLLTNVESILPCEPDIP